MPRIVTCVAVAAGCVLAIIGVSLSVLRNNATTTLPNVTATAYATRHVVRVQENVGKYSRLYGMMS